VKVAFKNGIHDCEERYDKIKLTPTNLVACEKQMDVVEAIMEDLEAMNAKEKKMMAIQKKIEKIVEDVDNVADDSSLKEEVREFSSKWLVVQSSIRQKKHQLEKLKTTMLNFNKSVCTVDDELKRLQDRTADDFVIGIVDSTAGQKVLDDITAIRKEVDEFDTKVDDVNKCGKELTALLDEYKADSHAVASQITDINDDHQKVKDDLAAKELESKKQIEIIDEFFKCSKHADEEVKKITKQKDELSALSAEPEIIKEQLSEVEVILDELRNLEPEQKRIEELCNDIVQHHDDFSVQSQARHMVKKITAPMDRLSLSLVERKSKLNNLLVGSQDLQDSFDDLGEKLLKIEKACAKLKPISAVYNVAKKQELTVQKLLDEVTSLAGSFEILARSVDELKHHTDAKEHDRVCKVKDKLKARWEVLHENLKKKNEVAESVIPVAQDYDERCIALSDWLVGAEKQLSTQEDLVVDEPAVAKELENVKATEKSIVAEKPTYESFVTISHSLCDLAECDEEPIKASVASVEERWNDVVAKNDEKMDRIKNVNEKLNSIKNEMEPIEEFFTFCEQSLANQKPIGIDKEKAHEQLAELDQLHSEILIKEENIIIIETIIEELASDPKLNVDTIKAQSNKLKEKHGEMTHDLLKKKEKLSEYIVYIEEYYIIIEEITIWVTHAKKNTALTDPIATETKVLKRQLKYLEALQDQVIAKKPKVERLAVLMEIITTECRTEFAVCNEVSTTYENTRSQIDDVTMKVEIRQNRLQETVLRSQKFEESLDDFLDTLSKLEERMEKEKPVSGKLELVKQQKDEHAQIHNDVMQLEPVFEQIIKAAENLIETSEAGDELEKFKQQVEETKQRYKSVQQTSLKRHKQINNGVLFTQKLSDDI